ncbi:MAG: hypothetical protein EOP69_00335 [Spirochaetia bacterium]|nr:MAG: hypothetical protein EOP69_00335 [Spirochaetia bacterium]
MEFLQWSVSKPLFVAGNSLSDPTDVLNRWSQVLAARYGQPLVSVARYSSDQRMVYRTGAVPLNLTLAGALPAGGSVAVTQINGAPIDGNNPAAFLTTGDPAVVTGMNMSGYVSRNGVERKVTVSAPNGASFAYSVTQAPGQTAITFDGPVLFTPEASLAIRGSTCVVWPGNNYFYSSVPNQYGDYTNPQMWVDLKLIVSFLQEQGCQVLLLPVIPASSPEWVGGVGTPLTASRAANARTEALFPGLMARHADGRDLIRFLQDRKDGSADAQADVAKGWIPRNLHRAGDTLHLNADGDLAVADFVDSALRSQVGPPAITQATTFTIAAEGAQAGPDATASVRVERDQLASLADAVDGVMQDAVYRPTIAAAIADFDVGTFFVSRDLDGLTAHTGDKWQYKVTAVPPYFSDQGAWSDTDAAALGLDAYVGTTPAGLPVSIDQAAADASVRNDALKSTGDLGLLIAFALDRRIRTDVPQALAEAEQATARSNMGAGRSSVLPLAMRSEIYSGARPVVPAARAGMTKDDLYYAQDIVYTASDPNTGADVTDLVQKHLLDCYLIARGLKNSAFDNLIQRARVRAFFPRGKYNVTSPIVVPPFVDMVMRGMLNRNFPVGSAPLSYDGDTSSKALSNVFQPALILGPVSHCAEAWIYCNPDGNPAHQGSGFVSGKNWGVSAAAIAGGTGYAVGDVLTGGNADSSPFYGFKLTLTAVDGAGQPMAWNITDSGVYALPFRLQQRVWTNAYGFDVFVGDAYKLSGGSGVGATATVAWLPDFANADYSTAKTVIGDALMGNIRVFGIGDNSDAVTYGSNFGVTFMGLNHTFDEIQTNGGGVAFQALGANDIRGNILNPCYPKIGLRLLQVGSMQCPNVVLDSCISRSIDMDKCSGVLLRGFIFWSESNRAKSADAPSTSGYQVRVGGGTGNASLSSFGNLLDFQFAYAGYGHTPGSPVAFLSYCKGSTFRFSIVNETQSGNVDAGPMFMSAVAAIGPGFASTNVIEGNITNVPGAIFGGNGLTAGDTAPKCCVRVWDAAVNGWCGYAGRYEIQGMGAPPVAYAAAKAATGSRYVDLVSGAEYRNLGTAAAPKWYRGPHVYEGGAVQALTGTTAEAVLATIVIPARTLGPKGQVEIEYLISNTNSAAGKTIKVKANGIAIASNYLTTSNTAALRDRLANRGVVNSQVAFPSGFVGTSSGAVTMTAIDTDASDLTITITGQLNTASESLALESFRVLVSPSL